MTIFVSRKCLLELVFCIDENFQPLVRNEGGGGSVNRGKTENARHLEQ